MLKKIIGLSLGLLLIIACLPLRAEIAQQSRGKDWWSMEHHDALNSGVSTATAPDYDNILWANSTNGDIFSSPTVVNGRVYVGTDDNTLYCYHAETGELIWKYSTQGYVRKAASVWQGNVYFGVDEGYNGCVYCLNATTGEFIWNHTINDNWFNMITSSPTLANGNLYIGSYNGAEYCLDARTGDFKWKYQTYGFVYSTAAVADGKTYFGSYDGFLYCVDARDGSFLWSFNSSTDDGGGEKFRMQRQITGAPSISSNNLVFSTVDGLVYCLDISQQGLEKWRYQASNGGDGVSPAIAYDRVYMSSYYVEMQPPYLAYGKVHCLNLTTGQLNWSYTTLPGNYWGSHAYSCSVADGKVYFGTSVTYYYPDHLYCLDAIHGKFLWRHEVSDDIRTTPAIADNKLYVTSMDGTIYCFEDDGEQPINQPPNPPTNPTPADNSQNVGLSVPLKWFGDDPDEEPLKYDAYLGTSSNPAQVSWKQIGTEYTPTTPLEYGSTYYWKIVASDYHDASSESPVWSFTTQQEQTPPAVQITKPKSGYLYLNDKEVMKRIFFPTTIIINPITIEVAASDAESGIRNVEFYIDGIKKANDSSAPYSWLWEEKMLFTHTIKVIAYDNAGNSAFDETSQKKFL